MEMELKDLINKIKKEGVEQAESDAQQVLADAKKEAEKIVSDATQKAEELLKNGKEEAKNFRAATEQALKQSARDALLTLRSRVTEFFSRIVKDKVSDQLKPNVLKDILVHAIEHYGKGSTADIEVLLSDADKKALQKTLFAALRKEARERVTLKGTKTVQKGFRIGEKGKDSYLDFTDQAIAEGFKRYLNPKLVEVLDIDLGLNNKKE